jgi:hypothetical protein
MVKKQRWEINENQKELTFQIRAKRKKTVSLFRGFAIYYHKNGGIDLREGWGSTAKAELVM